MQSLATLITSIKLNTDWLNVYKTNVPRFIEEAKTGKDWQQWDQDVFHKFFEKASNQCICSLKGRYFYNNEKDKIKAHWRSLAPLLKQLADNQDTPNYDCYQEINSIIRPLIEKNKRASI